LLPPLFAGCIVDRDTAPIVVLLLARRTSIKGLCRFLVSFSRRRIGTTMKREPRFRDVLRFLIHGKWTWGEMWRETRPYIFAGIILVAGVTGREIVKALFHR
jgi:hypothetical protein